MIAATTLVAALFGLPAPKAYAFFITNHEMITRNALPPDPVSQAAMLQILIGPPPGAGAVGSDAFPTDEWRHLDNSITPSDICSRALQAWNTFEPLIVSGSQLVGGVLANGPSARAAFGGLAHAQQEALSRW